MVQKRDEVFLAGFAAVMKQRLEPDLLIPIGPDSREDGIYRLEHEFFRICRLQQKGHVNDETANHQFGKLSIEFGDRREMQRLRALGTAQAAVGM